MRSLKMLMLAVLTVMSVAVFAQDTTAHKSKTEDQKSETTQYSCPMHPGVTSDKPGKCPKCGMDLTKSKKVQKQMVGKEIYTCTMHPEITSDKPGKCPKCGMDLVEKKDANTYQK